MSLYDIIEHSMSCPFCEHNQKFDIEVRFQNADLNTYHLGDKIIEINRNLKYSDIDIDGYAQCNLCFMDFFVIVSVKNKIISSINVDLSMKGYVEPPN